ncbi:MAG TPA: serine hydrolase domain-containing protein [Acidimicrobiales bacterium]|nr:serine hydrolase domain-containing protein [Acidimicrobiales bacterium]
MSDIRAEEEPERKAAPPVPLQLNRPGGAARRAGMDVGGLDEVIASFYELFRAGGHKGGQLAVWRNGEVVLEASAGRCADGRPVPLDGLACILSTTKAVAAILVHHLHDQGLFDYDDLVTKHWPDFAANGKDDITIGQVLSHRSGLAPPAMAGYLDWPEWFRPGGVAPLVEAMSPVWAPGSRNGYHAHTYGYVLDELVRRWTRRSLGQALRDEICRPLGIDVHIGATTVELGRYLPFWPVAPAAAATNLASPPGAEDHFFNSPAILALSLPWGNGIARAAALARLMGVYASRGRLDGREIFSPSTFERLVTPTNGPDDVDAILTTKARWGLGVHVGVTPGTLATRGMLFGTSAPMTTCGHMGGNSSLAWADPEAGVAMSFISLQAPAIANYEALSDSVRAACR